MTAGLADCTPFHSLAGGLMMASSLHTLLSKSGMVLGISGFFHSTVSSTLGAIKGDPSASQSSIFPLAARYFTAGILTGGVILGLSRNWVEAGLGVSILDDVTNVHRASLLKLAGLGAMVGFGTKLGNGCTSGHFLCGLSRLSLRSLVATATFFGVAVATRVTTTAPSATSSAAIKTTFASHLPSMFPQPDFGTLLVLQAPAIIYRSVPGLLGAIDPSAPPQENRSYQLIAARIMAFFVGIHFSFALAVSGMMRPTKVLGFLSLSPELISSGAWDPSLAMVAIGGIIPASIAYFREVKPKQDELRRRSAQSDSKRPAKLDTQLQPELSLVAPEWRTPANPSKIDLRLIGGSVLFGLGWGATGLCPGPALTSLASLSVETVTRSSSSGVLDLFVFVASMAVGGQIASSL
ncbi:sulfur transport domain protein [Kalmanozyma brasiliensis GHG001]|uniref:Sulphur transport domain-containing protein n=1 Tax=Kalmanozyma brasiliensis (strain GHG001) TaxID=1365824 RepID=V5GFS9_KALBG|nr:sulfur transport domain protein [Kalmanozyma brasiliensis GHG001]EST04882.1 sulfur transport domain protein [Kalmanozyma brasiliensis GHG001]